AARTERERGREALPGVGRRRRRDLRAADTVRRRSTQPQNLSHRDGAGGIPPRAARRAFAARPQHRASRPGAARATPARRACERALVPALLARPERLGAVTDLKSK